MKKKIVSLVLVFALALALGIGGTIAWLTDKTETVTNTFTVGDINITLTETERTYKMVPGGELDKDPTVSVVKDSEACWLFVKIDESENLDNFITYTVDSAWKKVDGEDNVYYIIVDADTAAAGESYPVLTNNKVSVNSEVTKGQMNELTDATKPTLAFTAYAIQSANLADQNGDDVVDAVDAWVLVSNQ